MGWVTMSSGGSDPTGGTTLSWYHTFRRAEIEQLSPSQWTATEWNGDLTVVIGGPGTGKSTTIGLLLDRLTSERDVPADECTVLSYNRSVATETQASLETELGTRGHEVDVQTAHAKAHDVLRQAPAAVRSTPLETTVADEVDQQLAMQAALHKTMDDGSVTEWQVKNALESITALKRVGLLPTDLANAVGDEVVFDTIEQLLDEIATAAQELLTPTRATPATLARLRSRLQVIGDALESEIPSEALDADDQPALVTIAWEYLDLLRRTTGAAQAWLAANESVICTDHPELAALPAALLGAPAPDDSLAGSIESWPCSHHPYREATLFVEEVKRAIDLLPTWRAYEAELEERELVDFPNLLADAIAVLEEDPSTRARAQVKRVVVDEGQDLSPLMVTFARHLTTDECIIYGDTCQTINEWAGANRYGITNLIDAGAEVLQLDLDYRKAPAIETLCDNVRATIDGESRLNLDSYRDTAIATEEAPPWPETPIRVVQQGDDWDDAYRAVLDAIETDSVPGWTVPEDASVATLARRKETVRECADIVSSGTASADTTPSIPALIELARFLSHVAGIEETTEYVGQHEGDPADDSDGSPVEALPRLLATWYGIPLTVAEEALDRDDCGPWIALVRMIEYGQDEGVEPSVYRSAFEHAYRDLIELAGHARRDPFGQLFRVLQDRFDIRQSEAVTHAAVKALEEAVAGIETPEEAPPPRPDPGALAQLEARWTSASNDDDTGNHTVSSIHRFKGSEADIVILPNLVAGPWSVLDTSSRSTDRRRAVNSLTRVRHGLASDDWSVTESLAQRKRHNERRVAYTALSRARDLLVLLGAPGGQPQHSSSAIDPDGCLPADVRRVENAQAFDIWTELQDALPVDGVERWSRTALGLDQEGGAD